MSDALRLVNEAKEAAKNAYTPYSGFCVGAALLAKSGRIYRGCNVENASYTPTNCAERTAFFSAVCAGEREFTAIAIVGGKGGNFADYCPPCGVCRQVMQEFCNDDFTVILGKNGDDYRTFTLRELLPLGFAPENLD